MASDGQAVGKASSSRSGSPPSISSAVIRKQLRTPIGFYNMKDKLNTLTSNTAFLDSILIVAAFIATITAFPFYPVTVIVILLVLLVVATLFHPFLGLVLYTALVVPIFVYQVPALAWGLLFLVTFLLISGYMYYRTIAFIYILTALAFSPLGYIFEIPVFIYAILTIGHKRAIIMSVATIAVIVVFSGITGVQNTGYILYNAQYTNSGLLNSPLAQIAQLDVVNKPMLPMGDLGSGFGDALRTFFSSAVIDNISNVMSASGIVLMLQAWGYMLQIGLLIVTVLLIDWNAVKSRSKFKGAISSLFGLTYPLSFILLAIPLGLLNVPTFIPLVSFMIAPAALYIMEYYEVNVVQSLEVRKRDVRMRFGEAFEDLAEGSSDETFADIGNYDSTKKELRDAILAPIEERAISRAYNVKPAKGILFFGPPGTGKTMMMRALSNEVKAGFYYMKANQLISAYPGETERAIANIFSIARKHHPAILFIDEIDTIATNRNNVVVDETHRHALSQLLTEMDGFNKIEDVIVVGATNVPNILDPAIMRPGRFDRIMYMPLPDFNGRKAIFNLYFKGLPVSKKMDLDALAKITERYSGADIRSVVESVSQMVSTDATDAHTVLEITQQDIEKVIKATKPSTSLSQIDDYKKFRLDFERRTFSEENEEPQHKGTTYEDVIGLYEVKKAVKDTVEVPFLHPDLAKKYGIKSVNGILLFGPPGAGKTMMMKAVESELQGVTMLELSGSEISNEGIERATATIKELFNRARENAPAIVFIDEIDGIAPKKEGASEMGIQVTTELLQQMDGLKELSNVVVIAATNNPENLDPALLRPGRLDKLIFVKPPTAQQRGEMFKKYLSDVPTSDDINYANLGSQTKGYTGADIENVCRGAKTEAMESELKSGKGSMVTMDIIQTILESTMPTASDSVVNRYLVFLSRYGQR
jgi:SpoVK/Ycf46/Vps4 family AAA+-type ATPase